MYCAITMFITLFLIIDAIGNVSSFIDILDHLDRKKYWLTVAREMFFALILMFIFNFLGSFLLDVLNVTVPTVWIASGVILFLAALSVLYPSERSPRLSSKKHPEPFIVPLAVPLIAGPAVLASIILYSQIYTDPLCRVASILGAWGLSALILFFGRHLYRFLGPNGLLALERLFALVLVIMATQRVMKGIKLLLAVS